MLISMDLAVPSAYLGSILHVLGAQRLDGFAEKCVQFGKGAKYIGSIVDISGSKFILFYETTSNKITIKPLDMCPNWNEKYVFTSEMPISIHGISSDDKAFFHNKEDAVEWLKNLSSIELLKLSVNAPDYEGPAVMYLPKE